MRLNLYIGRLGEQDAPSASIESGPPIASASIALSPFSYFSIEINSDNMSLI